MVEIIKDYPPNYERIKEVLNPPLTACFTYGDKIYFPLYEDKFPPDLMVHEEVHVKQQTNPAEWWDKYLTDKQFRQDQEVEAYATQFNWIKNRTNVKTASKYISILAEHLSTIYKLDIDWHKAHSLIRHKAKEL